MRAGLLIAIATMLAASVAHAEAIKYAVAPVMKGGKLQALSIDVSFFGEADGETEIELPNKWGGTSDLWRGISQLDVRGGSLVAAGAEPSLRIIRHEPGAKINLRYRLGQIWTGGLEGTEFRPIVSPNYFHVIGSTAFVHPKWRLATPVRVSFGKFPESWNLASDLEHSGLNLGRTLQSISVGGDFRVGRAGRVRVAMRGKWSFGADEFLKRLDPIIASHYRFWGDPRSAYLVTLIPLDSNPNRMTAGGTGLGDAFAFYATENIDDARILNGLAHEHLHSWIPLRLGSTADRNGGIADSWLSEGFTDFYMHRLLVRDELQSVELTASRLNEVMWEYAFSKERNATNARIEAEFWRDRAAQRVPYQRGLLVAALMDDLLRRASGGERDLDDVMLAMRRSVGAAEAEERPPIRDNFTSSMKSAGIDPTDDIKRFVDMGETVMLPGDIWAPCGEVETSEVAEFDRGFKGRPAPDKEVIVTEVDPDGPAYAAGLRVGMRILNPDFKGPRDSRVALTYRVAVDGEVREIRYFPEGKRRVSLQELKLRSLDEQARKACTARLGGLE
jgi:predicted metalloprotease with PDZ domain